MMLQTWVVVAQWADSSPTVIGAFGDEVLARDWCADHLDQAAACTQYEIELLCDPAATAQVQSSRRRAAR